MMKHATVTLPAIRLASRQHDVELGIEASLSLQLDKGHGRLHRSEDLLDLVKEKHLWIRRSGSCHLSVTISTQGKWLTGKAEGSRLKEWVEGCEIWHRLGLELQYCGTTTSPGEILFSIQHPDLSSALVAPRGALAADFCSVSCHIDIAKARGRKRKRSGTEGREPAQTKAPTAMPAPEYGLNTIDHQAIDQFVSSINLKQGRQQQAPCTDNKGDVESKQLLQRLTDSNQMRSLAQVAIRMLICGQKGQQNGLTTLQSNPSYSLVKLAPAVFHMPYLKTVSDRAKFLPVMATSLVRMKNAESPSLRQAVAAVTDAAEDVVAGEGSLSSGEQDVSAVEKRAWEVLLSAIKPAPLPQKLLEEKETQRGPEAAAEPRNTGSIVDEQIRSKPITFSHVGLFESQEQRLRVPVTAHATPNALAGSGNWSQTPSLGAGVFDAQMHPLGSSFYGPQAAPRDPRLSKSQTPPVGSGVWVPQAAPPYSGDFGSQTAPRFSGAFGPQTPPVGSRSYGSQTRTRGFGAYGPQTPPAGSCSIGSQTSHPNFGMFRSQTAPFGSGNFGLQSPSMGSGVSNSQTPPMSSSTAFRSQTPSTGSSVFGLQTPPLSSSFVFGSPSPSMRSSVFDSQTPPLSSSEAWGSQTSSIGSSVFNSQSSLSSQLLESPAPADLGGYRSSPMNVPPQHVGANAWAPMSLGTSEDAGDHVYGRAGTEQKSFPGERNASRAFERPQGSTGDSPWDQRASSAADRELQNNPMYC